MKVIKLPLWTEMQHEKYFYLVIKTEMAREFTNKTLLCNNAIICIMTSHWLFGIMASLLSPFMQLYSHDFTSLIWCFGKVLFTSIFCTFLAFNYGELRILKLTYKFVATQRFKNNLFVCRFIVCVQKKIPITFQKPP